MEINKIIGFIFCLVFFEGCLVTELFFRNGISAGNYPIKYHHECNTYAPKINFPKIPSFGIPIGSIIPESINGLVVSDKAMSGQAAGIIASLSIYENSEQRNSNIRKVHHKLLDSDAYLLPMVGVALSDSGFQVIQHVCASGILEVKSESYQWANRTWFFPNSTIIVYEFTEGINLFCNKVNIFPGNSVLPIHKASELIFDDAGLNDNEKIGNVWNNCLGTDLNPNRFVLKERAGYMVDSLI